MKKDERRNGLVLCVTRKKRGQKMIPYEVGPYVTARRVTCSEDKEATTHIVLACEKNRRRAITAESVTMSYL